MSLSEWLAFGQAVGGIAAAIGLLLTAWQLQRSRRLADLQTLQKFADDAAARESALLAASDQASESWEKAFYELLNFLELYAGAYNAVLIVGRHSRKTIRHKLLDSFIELEAAKQTHSLIEIALDRASTLDELRKLVNRHKSELEMRRLQRERFVGFRSTGQV